MIPTTPTLLYIEDDPALTRLVERGLGRAGFSVMHAASGQQGLDRLAQGGIDVVALGREDGSFFVIEGTAHTELTPPRGARVIGIRPGVVGTRTFALVVIDASRTAVSCISLNGDSELFRAPLPITHVAVDASTGVLAAYAEDDTLRVYSIARSELLHTFDFGGPR